MARFAYLPIIRWLPAVLIHFSSQNLVREASFHRYTNRSFFTTLSRSMRVLICATDTANRVFALKKLT
jgi:hypothetical protein